MRKTIEAAALLTAAISTAACGGEIDNQSFVCTQQGESASETPTAAAREMIRLVSGGLTIFVPVEASSADAEVSDFICVEVAAVNAADR